MSKKKTSKKDLRAGQVFDFLASVPDGATVDDIAAYLGCTTAQARDAIRQLRRILGDDDTINVPATSNGWRERWLYKLSGRVEDSAWWVTNRVLDAESRLTTIAAVMASAARSSDGRTLAGRKARKIHVTVSRLIEDLGDMRDDPGLL